MATSQNGWPARPDLPLRKLVVAGESFSPGILDNDDVYEVLRYVAEQMNARVERIHKPGWHEADEWGFYYRANRNSPNSLSNHSSGTAFDYNATRHPNGVPTAHTFTRTQIEEIHQILREVDNVVRWGGDYQRTPDSMHFEINADRASVARAAARVRKPVTNYEPFGEADIVYQNVKVHRNSTIDDLLDALASSKPRVIALLECGGNWEGIKRWAKVNGYSVFTGRSGDDISTNGGFLVKYASGAEDFGYATISTPWYGPKHTRKNPRVIRGRTAYWLTIVLDDEPYLIVLAHHPWGYLKVVRNAVAYIQYARLIARWGGNYKTTRSLLILEDGNLSAASTAPWSPLRVAKKIGAKIIKAQGPDHVIFRARPHARHLQPSVEIGTDDYDSDHPPFKVNLRRRR